MFGNVHIMRRIIQKKKHFHQLTRLIFRFINIFQLIPSPMFMFRNLDCRTQLTEMVESPPKNRF